VRNAFSKKAFWWDNNRAVKPDASDRLYAGLLAHAKGVDLYAKTFMAAPGQPRPMGRVRILELSILVH